MSDERIQPRPRRRRLRKAALLVGAAAVAATGVALTALAVLNAAFPYPEAKLAAALKRYEGAQVLDREGNRLRCFLGPEDTWLFPVALSEVSSHVTAALIAVEDERFRRHPGVDPISIVRAIGSNVRRRRVVSGASTLTMQAVRLVEPRPRTLRSKAVEAFQALQLERIRSKDEILELYLNLAPFGGNLIGIEAASRAYFGKHARDLTLAEAALLAGLVQAPSRLRPDRHPDRARRRRDHVLDRMRECGFVDARREAFAKRTPVRTARGAHAFGAPHFARMVRGMVPERETLRTALDSAIQWAAEQALRERVAALRPAGVTNGAVVVIENATGAVRAMVGSCDFFSEEDNGQVNGALAPRSPGSALKPFIYALAFETGEAMPATVLADVPTAFAGYVPANYDRRYHGPVPARDALAYSLNVPAVALLNRIGVREAHAFLRAAGITTLNRDADHYGLALVLGSAEVNLLELTNAYAALARLGVWRPWRVLEAPSPPPGRRVLSPGAAWLVADVLRDRKRLGGTSLWRHKKSALPMAWKTGTSYGHRDAWTVAYTPHYTVGVWLGNFNGKPARALVGMTAAAPVAARILDQISRPGLRTWYRRPESWWLDRRPPCVVKAQAEAVVVEWAAAMGSRGKGRGCGGLASGAWSWSHRRKPSWLQGLWICDASLARPVSAGGTDEAASSHG